MLFMMTMAVMLMQFTQSVSFAKTDVEARVQLCLLRPDQIRYIDLISTTNENHHDKKPEGRNVSTEFFEP